MPFVVTKTPHVATCAILRKLIPSAGQKTWPHVKRKQSAQVLVQIVQGRMRNGDFRND